MDLAEQVTVEIDAETPVVTLDEALAPDAPLGLSGRVGNHRGDRLAKMVDTLTGEDRLRYRDKIRAVEARTDRFDFAQRRRGYDRHSRRRVHRQNAAPCDRAAHKAQHAGTPRQIGGVAAAPSQQNQIFVARQWPPDPSHFEDAWSKMSFGSC